MATPMLFCPDRLAALSRLLFLKSGSDEREADIVSGHLVDACLSGHDSHGMIRVAAYLNAVRKGELFPNKAATVVFETGSLTVLEGHHGYGQVVALDATDAAIAKARTSGIAMVTVRNAGHVGRLGAWAERAASAGQATIYFANSARPGGAQLAPFGGSDRRLNSGPVCLGMPVEGKDPIVLDISTASVAMGKVRLARNRGEKLREACIVDADGRLTDDPAALYGPPPGALLPFGGHKGSGLSIFTDLFGGILSGAGANYRGEPCEWYPHNNMVAIHIDVAQLGYGHGLTQEVIDYMAWVKESPSSRPEGVLMPGEFEAQTRRIRKQTGIELDEATWEQLLEAGASWGLAREEAARIALGDA